jgi:hypothetical protein
MAVWTARTPRNLGPTLILAPERYDPRRERLNELIDRDAVALHTIARTVRDTLRLPGPTAHECLVLDTSDAREGIVINRKHPVPIGRVKSAKKTARIGDVIVSRLRPYLRQVALVDDGIRHWRAGMMLACSTEFYVLRCLDGRSIAFLVPYLLSNRVQKVLAVAQEGGHHPRVDQATLLRLPVPRTLVDERDVVSQSVEESVRTYRRSEQGMSTLIARVEAEFQAHERKEILPGTA